MSTIAEEQFSGKQSTAQAIDPVDVCDKFATMANDLATALIEREDEIAMCQRALVSGDHVLLVGVPGVAKSMLCESYGKWLTNGVYFEWLLGKYSVPEELFGAISVAGMKQDDYRRVTHFKMPEAHFVFLDEIFKASSAILNTTLKILNERTFANGRTIQRCPLQMCLAASNEWPDEQEELGALFDRFLFRRAVHPIRTRKGLDSLLWTQDLQPTLTTSITPDEIEVARAAASQLQFTDDAREAFHKIIRDIRSEGVFPGDRRLRKSVNACKSTAWLANDIAVQPDHLEVLADILWDDPTEQPLKVAQVVGTVANPVGMKVNSLLMESEQLLQNADTNDLNSITTVVKKLQDVAKRLKEIGGNGRAERARDYLEQEIRRLKIAVVGDLTE